MPGAQGGLVLPAAGLGAHWRVGEPVGGAEDLVHDLAEARELVVVDGDENDAGGGEKLVEQSKTRVHHAQPLVVAGEVLALLADDVAQPLLDPGVVDVVVVDPAFVACVVGRVDVDAVDSALVLREQRLESFEIIAVDDHVRRPVVVRLLATLIE